MKNRIKTPHILFAILVAAACLILLSGRGHSGQPAAVDNTLGAEQLYVWIQADTLEQLINRAYTGNVVDTHLRSDRLKVTYNKAAKVLLHANYHNMGAIRDTLKAVDCPYRIDIDDSSRRVTLTLGRRGDYVSCPTAIIAEVVR